MGKRNYPTSSFQIDGLNPTLQQDLSSPNCLPIPQIQQVIPQQHFPAEMVNEPFSERIVQQFDYVGTACFAFSGTTIGMGLDLAFPVSMLAGACSAIGGGTLRDVIILRRLPFWIADLEYIWLCFFFSCLGVYSYLDASEGTMTAVNSKTFVLVDDCSLASFVVLGARAGLRAAMPLPLAVLCGMCTGIGGGVTRDLFICQRDVMVLRVDTNMYAESALAGSCVFVMASHLALPSAVCLTLGASIVVALRQTAVANDWTILSHLTHLLSREDVFVFQDKSDDPTHNWELRIFR